MIRPAKPSDLDAITELNRSVQLLHAQKMPRLFKYPSDDVHFTTWFQEEFQNPLAFILVAGQEGKVFGYLYAKEIQPSESSVMKSRRSIMLHHIAVNISCQRNGLGGMLMEGLIAEAKARGLSQIDLDVWEFNDPAKRFFSKYGFETHYRRMKSLV